MLRYDGFRSLISVSQDDLKAYTVRLAYQETIEHLKKHCNEYESGCIDYCWFSDTFLMFTHDDSARSYSVIELAAKRFMHDCIYHSQIPIRGAITVGPFIRTADNRSFIGTGFLEAFEYAEDQDWIGLLLTPTAIKKIESFGLNLIYDFVRSDKIPMRKFSNQNVLAYRFQNGAANFPCPLLPALRDMKLQSDEKYRYKYERTEQFIEEHYSYLK